MHLCMLSCPYQYIHDHELLHGNAKDGQELLHSNAKDGTCIPQCLTSMHATTCVSITPPLLANHVRVFYTPLIQASNARVLQTSCATHIHVLHTSCTPLIQATNVRVLQTSLCPIHHERPCVVYITDTSYVRVQHMSRTCVVYTTDTSNPSLCVGLSCEPLHCNTSYTHQSVAVYTTDASYKCRRDFF